MRLYEATAFFVDQDDDGKERATFLVPPEHVFAETDHYAEKEFIIRHSSLLGEYRIEEVTILVRPFA